MAEEITTPEETIINVRTFDGNIMFLNGIEDLLQTIQVYECKTLQWIKERKPHYQKQHSQDSEAGIDGIVFAFVSGIAWAVPINEFTDFNEMKAGFQLGFTNGRSYRDSTKIGTRNAAEYKEYRDSGFDDLSIFRNYQKTSLPQLFRVWVEQYEALLPRDELPNPLNLQQYISMDIIGLGGFSDDNILETESAYKCGFWKQTEYQEAIKAGFQTASDFFQAQYFSISSPDDLKLMRSHGIDTPEAWEIFRNLHSRISEEKFTDAVGYFVQAEIKAKPAGNRWALSAFQNLIKQKLTTPCRMTQGPYLDFIKQDNTSQKVHKLSKHPDLLPYIITSSDSAIMRRHFTLKERETAIIDVSNVILHNNDSSDVRKGEPELLYTIVEKLRNLGVQTIYGIADASIKLDLTKDELKKISNELDNFQIVKPAEPADIYILAMVEDIPSVIISNDKFIDWRTERHPWRQQNLDRLLIQFDFLEDGTVYFGEKEREFDR